MGYLSGRTGANTIIVDEGRTVQAKDNLIAGQRDL